MAVLSDDSLKLLFLLRGSLERECADFLLHELRSS